MSTTENVSDVSVTLNLPKIVTLSTGRLVEVRRFSARDTIILGEKIVSIAFFISANSKGGTQAIVAIRQFLMTQPDQIISLISGATNVTAKELGDLFLEDFLAVVEGFIEMHEAALERFFGVRGRVDAVLERARPRSPNSSTTSSAQAGDTLRSLNSQPKRSNSSSEEPLPEASEPVSSD